MKKTITIGIFGASLDSVNYGVTALALTQIKLLQKIEKEIDARFDYWIFADDSKESIEKLKRKLEIENIYIKYIVRIKTGISGYRRLKKDIRTCDLVIDLTYGDSFSDIYGLKSFYLYSLPKLVAIWNKKILVLGPQTIGPFFHVGAKNLATYILKRSNYIFARDKESEKYAKEISGRNDIVRTSDLAMSLPYQKDESVIRTDGFRIGLNVSQLMWNNDNNNPKLSVRLSYKELIRKLLDEFLHRGIEVHLIAHVYDKTDYNEYTLAKELHDQYENTVLAPSFSDPIDAKNYISGLDLFIGSRMHATIGAFSAGVPVIPISYSRKFEGLYGSIGYNHCVACKGEKVSDVLNEIMEKVKSVKKLEEDRRAAYAEAIKRNGQYFEKLKNIIETIV